MKFRNKLIFMLLTFIKIIPANKLPEIERVPSYDGHPLTPLAEAARALQNHYPKCILRKVNSYQTKPPHKVYYTPVDREYLLNRKKVDATTFFLNAPVDYLERQMQQADIAAKPELVAIFRQRQAHIGRLAEPGVPYANEINARRYWDIHDRLIKEGEIKERSCTVQ